MGRPVLLIETWMRLVVPDGKAHVLRLLPSILRGGTASKMSSLIGPMMLLLLDDGKSD